MWILKNRFFQLFLITGLFFYLSIEAKGEGDLFIYFCAAFDLNQGLDFYKTTYIDGFHYYYSVLFAYFLSLVMSLPFYGLKFTWLLLNVIMFAHLFKLLKQSGYVSVLNDKQRNYFLIFVFLFSLRFLHQNIHSAQVTIFILWTCIYGLICIEKGKEVKGSALLALGINIKLLPLVFLPYLLYRAHYKSFALTFFFLVAFLFIPSILIGHDYNLSLLSSWYQLINPSNPEHILDTYERSFHGLSTFLTTLLVSHPPDPYALSLKRNLADVSIETLKLVLMISRAGLVFLTLYFLSWPPFVREKNKQQLYLETSYILLLIPLIFPHQQHYAFLFMVPAFSLVLIDVMKMSRQYSKAKRVLLISALIFIYLSANLSILLGEFNRYYEHYKLLTYGALLLIPLLIWQRKKNQSLA